VTFKPLLHRSISWKTTWPCYQEAITDPETQYTDLAGQYELNSSNMQLNWNPLIKIRVRILRHYGRTRGHDPRIMRYLCATDDRVRRQYGTNFLRGSTAKSDVYRTSVPKHNVQRTLWTKLYTTSWANVQLARITLCDFCCIKTMSSWKCSVRWRRLTAVK
jgi:hypothetical protein